MTAHHTSGTLTPSVHSGSFSTYAFTEELFDQLPRADQRRWAHTYLEGLLTTAGKKSVRRMAAAVSGSRTASQSLQQFVNASPWEWSPIRRELIRWVEQYTTPRAWTIACAVLPKRGDHSVGVHRRFVPAAGRAVNCQIGVGLFLSTGHGELPVDWRLLLPGAWSEQPELRQRARVPEEAPHGPIWAHARDLVEELARHTGAASVPVIADMGECTEVAALIRGLGDRDFVIAVPGSLQVVPGGHLATQRPTGHGMTTVTNAQHFLGLNGAHPQTAAISTHDGRARHLRILSGLARLPGTIPGSPGGQQHTYKVFSEWRQAGRRPAPIWITNMVHRRMDELLALTGLQHRADNTVRTLENDFGLLDFEGRSYPGWHHHMTLVSAAYAYHRIVRPEAQSAASPFARQRSA
ncbi:hypothetical protein F4556_002863 [Kitasatospora gansuensis]|uniref:Transposase IS701-like DDE domain-containing protein n=1 Tax=Kitasatospora gansuensis TaxID=258050 RepID=A0A7W7SBD4_9ACTN|nr:transposase [Kitasatospora gansuensis]MBB4947328.1 hypothetical protein [Kitasatospora gansuensis]